MTALSFSRFTAALLIALTLTGITAGCASDPDAMPEAEMSAALKTRDEAKALQAESKTRVNDANAVIDGK